MKVRIAGNSIRFRLKQPEVTSFKVSGTVTERIEFGPESEDQIHFRLETYAEPHLSIDYEQNAVTVYVPEELAYRWTDTPLVGFDGKLNTAKGRTVSVLVEKDFACLDRGEDENEGTYPHPLANCQPEGAKE